MRNCHRSAVSSRGAQLGAGGSRAVKQAAAALWAARIYAPQEQLYLSSVKSLIYRETPSGKAISLEPAMLGIYNCPAGESSSLPPFHRSSDRSCGSAPRNGCLLPHGIPAPLKELQAWRVNTVMGIPIRGTAGNASVRNSVRNKQTCAQWAKGNSHGK